MNGNRHGSGERRKEEVVMKYLIIIVILLITVSVLSTVGLIDILYGALMIGVIVITTFLWLGALIVHEMGKGNG